MTLKVEEPFRSNWGIVGNRKVIVQIKLHSVLLCSLLVFYYHFFIILLTLRERGEDNKSFVSLALARTWGNPQTCNFKLEILCSLFEFQRCHMIYRSFVLGFNTRKQIISR